MDIIYRYVHVDTRVLKRFSTELYKFLWLPMLMTRLPNCRPRDAYLLDCLFTQLSENPYAMLMLFSRVSQKTSIVDSMPFNAKKVVNVECNAISLAQNLNAMASEVVNNNYTRLYQIIERVAEFRDVVIPYRAFFRTKRYVMPAEKIREYTLRIASSTVRKTLEHLCCIENNVVKGVEVEAQPVYTLAFFSSDFSDGGIIVNKKVIRFRALAKLVKLFEAQLAEITVEPVAPW